MIERKFPLLMTASVSTRGMKELGGREKGLGVREKGLGVRG